MKKKAIINIYNFIRRSHEEPGCFIQDDFDTIANQMMLLKQLGLPSTYALKHDALIDPRYQELLLELTDESDEIAAWWEITGELCRRAGVTFLGERGEVHDDRVSTAYCLGYTPEERKRLVDAYMSDFKDVFGFYPRTLGSWIIDIVTFQYAKEKYGVRGGALCRDQIGVDGFTLWGGYVNGIYYPSLKNEMIPAQTEDCQLDLPIFRLLGPDPIYNFEEGFQSDITGVYSLEPSCVVGRDENWITWMFERLTDEDSIGVSYAQVGQENNFLWENIEPGFELQLKKLKKLAGEGKVRIETMAETAEWFHNKYKLTPASTFQASVDWHPEHDLKTLWYCSRFYRISFLIENETMFIRDWFLFDQEYPSRYLEEPLRDVGSIFDALPLMDAHSWKTDSVRPKAALVDSDGHFLSGKNVAFCAKTEDQMDITWQTSKGEVTVNLLETSIEISGNAGILFTHLPILQKKGTNYLQFKYRDFSYEITLDEGLVKTTPKNGIWLQPENGKLVIRLAQLTQMSCLTPAYLQAPEKIDNYRPRYLETLKNTDRKYPATAPKFPDGDRACLLGETYFCEIKGEGEIFYTLDGTEPNRDSLQYHESFVLTSDTVVKARCYQENFLESCVSECHIYFGLPVERIESSTKFDARKVFNKNGAWDLLDGFRGSLDYQDGRWLGTLEDLDVVLKLPQEQTVKHVRIGFISHHRSGIIYPDYVELYAGNTKEDMVLADRVNIANEPGRRQIERQDIVFDTAISAQYLRIFAHNLRIQPDWACYHGMPGVFLMADSIIIY